MLVAEDADPRPQGTVEPGVEGIHHQGTDGLVVHAFHYAVFQCVTERSVADVVQQDGHMRAQGLLVGDAVALGAQGGHGLAHQVHGAQRVVEAGVQRAGVHQVAQPQLLDVAEPLEPRMVDQPLHHRVGHGDEPVDGVVEDLAGSGHADRQSWRGFQGFRPSVGRSGWNRPNFTHRK